MPTTTTWGIEYPLGTAAPNVPLALQTLAESVEDALDDATAKIAWTPLTLINGYAAYVGGGGYYQGLRASKSGNFIHVHGMVKNPTSGDPATVIAVLPVNLRPMYTILAPVTTGNASATRVVGNVTISADGNIAYQSGVTDPTFVGFNFTIPVN